MFQFVWVNTWIDLKLLSFLFGVFWFEEGKKEEKGEEEERGRKGEERGRKGKKKVRTKNPFEIKTKIKKHDKPQFNN